MKAFNMDSVSTFSTLSTPGQKLDNAIYPTDSWLERYMEYARKREESADSYLIGSIIPVVSAVMARRVWFPWGDGKVYPNIFAMLAGKPGDRKSSAINLAEKVAKVVIDQKHFLPDAMSAEAMFGEYDQNKTGSPDKLLIADDANSFLGMVQKSNYGERVGQSLLRLYDCKGMAESFRRNQEGSSGSAKRVIDETSTSMVLGATFNICQFQGHEIRSGLQRRFLYYVAGGHGRFIVVPTKSDAAEFQTLCGGLSKMSKLDGLTFDFSPDAQALWEEFQRDNRKRLETSADLSTDDALLSRLNGQPNHVLKLAMIFEATLWAETDCTIRPVIQRQTLQTAFEHSDLCLAAAQQLQSIANRTQIQQDAEVLLSNIQQDFRAKSCGGEIELTRSELTSKYAHHSQRRGALKTDDLYLRLIPEIIRQGKAREIPRNGKPAAFAFKP